VFDHIAPDVFAGALPAVPMQTIKADTETEQDTLRRLNLRSATDEHLCDSAAAHSSITD
jgi:hypothetical protein